MQLNYKKKQNINTKQTFNYIKEKFGEEVLKEYKKKLMKKKSQEKVYTKLVPLRKKS